MRRLGALVAAVGMAVTSLALLQPADASVSALRPFAATRTLKRAHLEASGTQTVVDTRTVTVHVEQTAGLRPHQPVRVSWSGAHPTGGVVADGSSATARLQEYPLLLIQCRGVDDPSAAPADRLSPETCWTQTTAERFTADYTNGFPAWRVDRKAPAAERHAVVGAPDPRAATCGGVAKAERWLPFVAAGGTRYLNNLTDCGTRPPESAEVQGAGAPSNTTYAITEPDGTGATKFSVWTAEDNASLGCSATVACSLVIVPIMGISCDDTGLLVATADRPDAAVHDQVREQCRAKGNYPVGAPLQNSSGQADAVSGALWWSASNWSQRITVPLSFAPSAGVCEVVGGKAGVDVYGSELLDQATAQWRPAFCTNHSATPFKHVQVGEPQAANLVAQAAADAAFVVDPPSGGWTRPVTMAPTAVTAFSVSYVVDGADHQPITDLKLTPRLLAKLLTMSYPAVPAVQTEYAALAHNPIDITRDPEFLALNPGVAGVLGGPQAAELFSLSSDSDVVYALTSYLQQDRDARSFLDGTPDPWGMVVNPSYARIALPVRAWPQKDTFEPKDFYASGVNPCLQYDPVPYLPLVAAPTQRLTAIAAGVQYGLANPQLSCVDVPGLDQGAGSKLVALGRMRPGYRFLIGLTALGDARRYLLDSAALLTRTSTSAAERFTSAAGRTFVAPTDAALRIAAAHLVPAPASASWRLDGAAADAAGGYPGTLVVSTAVRTQGLPAPEAKGYAEFLRFVAGPGQRPGLTNGTLPPGYLPLPAELADHALRAAAAVAAQAGDVPAPVAVPARPPVGPAPAPTPRTAGGATVPTSLVPPAPMATPAGPSPRAQGPMPAVAPVEALRATAVAESGLASSLLPLLVVAGVGGVIVTWVLRRALPR